MRAIPVIILLALIGCARDALPLPAPLPADPPQERPAPVHPDSRAEQLDRRIADLQGQLAQAQADRQAEKTRQDEAETRATRRRCRWIAAIVIPLAIAAATLSLWLGFARLGLPIAGAAIAAVLALQIWAEAQAYLWIALPAIAVLGLIAGALVLHRFRTVAATAAGVSDAIEAGAGHLALAEAKAAAWAAQHRAGLHQWIQRQRGKPPKRLPPVKVTP